jgi:ABC-2 type transport system permease protein
MATGEEVAEPVAGDAAGAQPAFQDAEQGLPVTHGAKAARQLVGGASLGHVATLLAAEALVGAAYVLVGLAAIRFFEFEARRGATLEVS